MPKFEVVSQTEAMLKSASGKAAQAVREYAQYIERLGEGEAGKLQAAAGENLRAVRRRLGTASKHLGIDLVIKRAEDGIYFWRKRRRKSTGRRGRPRKNPVA